MAGWLISVMDDVNKDPLDDATRTLRELIPAFEPQGGFGGEVIDVIEGFGTATWVSGIGFPTASHARGVVEHPAYVATEADRLKYYKRTLYIVGEPSRNLHAQRGAFVGLD